MNPFRFVARPGPCLRKKQKIMLFMDLGGSVMGKTVHSVLSTAEVRVLKTLGTVFPNTDLPWGQ